MLNNVINPLRNCRLCLVALLAASLTSSPALAGGNLQPHSAEYTVWMSIASGRLHTTLRETASGFSAEHQIKPTGLSRLLARGAISESSDFAVGTDGLRPVAYRSNDTLSRDQRDADVRFDWESNRAVGTVNGAEFEAELAEFSHDRVSIQYQLMLDLLRQEANTTYQLFDIDKQKLLNVRMLPVQTVKVRAGTFEAIGIQHQAENSSRVTTLWCVEELGYLPVMIEQHRKGKLRVRAKLRSYTPDN